MDADDLRAVVREDADQRRSEQPAGDDERDDDAIDRHVELVHELVEPLVHEADLHLTVAHLLEHVVDLVRQLPCDSEQLPPLPLCLCRQPRG